MRRKNRKFKQDEGETNTSDKAEGSDIDNNDENHAETDEDSDTPEPESKKRKSDKKVSFSPKKAAKEKKENASTKDIDNGEPQYEVESVVDEKTVKGLKHYLIRWKGFDEESDTWEPENILNCPDLIKQFNTNRKSNASSKSKKIKDPKKKNAKKNNSKSKVDDEEQEEEEEWDENEEFEIDRIIEVHHRRDGKREFLVSWKGYPHSQDSWVQEEDMTCNDLIAKFMAKVEKARESEQKDLRVKPPRTDRFTLSTKDTGRRLSKRNSGKQRVQYHDAE